VSVRRSAGRDGPSVGLVARLLRRRDRERSPRASERYAQSMVGYSPGSPRRIDVSPVRPPVMPNMTGGAVAPSNSSKATRPLVAVEAGGGASEQVFDSEFIG
jgi:hypothetical protein